MTSFWRNNDNITAGLSQPSEYSLEVLVDDVTKAPIFRDVED